MKNFSVTLCSLLLMSFGLNSASWAVIPYKYSINPILEKFANSQAGQYDVLRVATSNIIKLGEEKDEEGNPKDNSDIALEILRQLQKNGISLDILAYTSTINALAKAGTLNAATMAHGLLVEMWQNGITPDVITYNTVINAFAQIDTFDANTKEYAATTARELLVEMWEFRQYRIIPTAITYASTINAFAKLGTLNAATTALGFLAKMWRMGITPDAITYNSVINAFAQIDTLDTNTKNYAATTARRLLNEMRQYGITPDEITLRSVANLEASAVAMNQQRLDPIPQNETSNSSELPNRCLGIKGVQIYGK